MVMKTLVSRLFNLDFLFMLNYKLVTKNLHFFKNTFLDKEKKFLYSAHIFPNLKTSQFTLKENNK